MIRKDPVCSLAEAGLGMAGCSASGFEGESCCEKECWEIRRVSGSRSCIQVGNKNVE